MSYDHEIEDTISSWGAYNWWIKAQFMITKRDWEFIMCPTIRFPQQETSSSRNNALIQFPENDAELL